MSRLLAVDWGSSRLRAALLDEEGRVLDRRSAPSGMLNVQQSGFDEVFESQVGDWMDVPGTRCLMAGMVGSRQGWVEAEYVACPAGIEDFVGHLRRVAPDASRKGRDIAIVPGASCIVDDIPDVLRGEEIKMLGVLDLLGVESAVVLSPGTHSKWMTVENGRLARFATAMTGEVYGLLRRESILARSMPAQTEDALDAAVFDDAVRHALRSCSLLQTAFSVRTRALFGDLPPASLASALSGLVIGEELRCRQVEEGRAVALVGAPALTERYARALRLCGAEVRTFGEEAVWRGIWAIDQKRARREGGRA
jgi:2-dehydro-3-deoxygalactonokinase